MNSEINEDILFFPVDSSLKKIAEKILKGQRIDAGETLLLYENAGLGWLSLLSEIVRRRLNGNDVYYIRNFHIEPTNICVNRCRFCSYSNHFSKKSWDLTIEEMLDSVCKADATVREIHITGAVHPEKGLQYYGELFKKVHDIRPDLHIKALSAVELDYIIKKEGITNAEGLKYLKDCGLNSIPGGGAEILDDTLRKKICETKASTREWLAVHEAAHRLGITSNATMLYGHIETYRQRILHMQLLRDLQDQTGGFNAFIPLKFRNMNNELSGISETSVIEDMKNYAIARLFLDNFPHLKGYWPMLGKPMAQLALSFGVDDMDGTINDSTRIYSLAGAEEQTPQLTVSEMKTIIQEAHRIPVERDSLYNKVN
ncbi:MAG: CofH family radical SAM protein [Bacteroidota bacterium]|nr:CofH family radical SAM protein [Bacteroidota bacterium]